jgi:hypothetical protein
MDEFDLDVLEDGADGRRSATWLRRGLDAGPTPSRSLNRLRRELADDTRLGRRLVWLGRISLVVVVLLGLWYAGRSQAGSAALLQRPPIDGPAPVVDPLVLAASAALTGQPVPQALLVHSAVPLSESVVGGGHVANDPVAVAQREIHRGPIRIISGVYQIDLACAGSGTVTVELSSGIDDITSRLTCQPNPEPVVVGITVVPQGLTVSAVPGPHTDAALAWRARRE